MRYRTKNANYAVYGECLDSQIVINFKAPPTNKIIAKSSLDGNDIGTRGTTALANALTSTNCRLTHL